MDDETRDGLAAIRRLLDEQHLPRWRELPDLDLYMDQVLLLIDRTLGTCPGFDGLTASMVNNYVKLGVMPPPRKKRYTRTHLAYLIVICALKPVLPIPSIRRVIEQELSERTEEAFYDRFCALFEASNRAAAEALPDGETSPLSPALRSRAERTLALACCAAFLPAGE